jgi:hypothetical protein
VNGEVIFSFNCSSFNNFDITDILSMDFSSQFDGCYFTNFSGNVLFENISLYYSNLKGSLIKMVSGILILINIAVTSQKFSNSIIMSIANTVTIVFRDVKKIICNYTYENAALINHVGSTAIIKFKDCLIINDSFITESGYCGCFYINTSLIFSCENTTFKNNECHSASNSSCVLYSMNNDWTITFSGCLFDNISTYSGGPKKCNLGAVILIEKTGQTNISLNKCNISFCMGADIDKDSYFYMSGFIFIY